MGWADKERCLQNERAWLDGQNTETRYESRFLALCLQYFKCDCYSQKRFELVVWSLRSVSFDSQKHTLSMWSDNYMHIMKLLTSRDNRTRTHRIWCQIQEIGRRDGCMKDDCGLSQ
jgi:sugar (pentulose or hexulose) kinase